MRPTPALAAALVLALCASGCAGYRARQAREAHLRRELDGLRYQKPLQDVWQQVRVLLAAEDYPLAGEDARAVGKEPPGVVSRMFSPARETRPYREETGLLQRLGGRGDGRTDPPGLSLDTGWRRTRDRVHADAVEDRGGVRVVLARIEEDQTEHRSMPGERDLDLELELARRVDPALAERIEAALGER